MKAMHNFSLAPGDAENARSPLLITPRPTISSRFTGYADRNKYRDTAYPAPVAARPITAILSFTRIHARSPARVPTRAKCNVSGPAVRRFSRKEEEKEKKVKDASDVEAPMGPRNGSDNASERWWPHPAAIAQSSRKSSAMQTRAALSPARCVPIRKCDVRGK